MGKPRMIIVIRHAQSEGNENRAIHQTVPDHRVKLTPHGWTQASEAGRRLRSLLKSNDTLHFFTSPYRRTRETTEGILSSLTCDDEAGPSPFPRNSIKVWEEPRLREQDFGNFQPCSAQMERMWQERADYGHFFYRIPNGESAADAYDRISGFNETLWRSFGEEDFASVCVLVTHGLMTRIFLMKWYHWSVEYFEDLRNVNHCEFVLMSKHEETGKYMLQNNLRTWSELRRQKALEAAAQGISAPPSAAASKPASGVTSPAEQKKQWGGCPEGCTHEHEPITRRPKRQTTQDSNGIHSSIATDPPASTSNVQDSGAAAIAILSPNGTTVRPAYEEDEEAFPKPSVEPAHSPMGSPTPSSGPPPTASQTQTPYVPSPAESSSDAHPQRYKGKPDLSATGFSERLRLASEARPLPSYLEAGRDFGGSRSGAVTPTLATTATAPFGLPSTYMDDTPHGQPPSMGVQPAADYGFPYIGPGTSSDKLKSPVRAAFARPVVASRLGTEVVEQSETDKVWPAHVRQDELDDEAEECETGNGVELEDEAARTVGSARLDSGDAVGEDERQDRSLRGSVY